MRVNRKEENCESCKLVEVVACFACDRWEEKPKSNVRYTNATDDDYEFQSKKARYPSVLHALNSLWKMCCWLWTNKEREMVHSPHEHQSFPMDGCDQIKPVEMLLWVRQWGFSSFKSRDLKEGICRSMQLGNCSALTTNQLLTNHAADRYHQTTF